MQYNNRRKSNEVIRMNPERMEAMCGGKGHVLIKHILGEKRSEWKSAGFYASDSGAGVFPWLP